MKTRIKTLLILIMVCSVGLWAQFARAAHLKAGQALVIQPPGQFACQTPAEWMNLTVYAEQNDMVAILESLRSEQCFNLIAGTKVRGFKFQVQQLVKSWSGRIPHTVS